RLESEAFLDSLLGIPSRSGFERVILRQQKRFPDSLLMLVDIDDFSSINSTLDQHYGDDVLRAVCQRLQMLMGDNSILGRISGDCFGLVGPLSTIDSEAILKAFDEPFDIHDSRLLISATCGVVKLNAEGATTTATELLKDANIALKQAKMFSRGKIQSYDVSLRKAAVDRIALLNGLREAFSARHLFLCYQPQIELSSGRVVGAEALLRWRNASGQFIPPDQFIPLAEQSGIIIPIGTWVLRTACMNTRQMIDAGYTDFRMAVNVSHAQLRDPGFIPLLAEVMQEHGVPGQNLELELTESIAIDDLVFINGLLASMREFGVSVALDDFGTGYSSLSLLSRLAVDRLKIDRAFTASLLEDALDSQLAKVMVHLAQDFNLCCIAEGIESAEQMSALDALGCNEGQGYHIARPMDFSALMTWMQAYEAR
ncbi:MAG: bifunctional diguanylate cyclase/phosphodiesterase, partial [Pseudomonadaceae bacterium]